MWRTPRSTAALVILIGFHLFPFMKVQTITAQSFDFEIKSVSQKGQLLSHILKVVNHSDRTFNGNVMVDATTGIRTLSRDEQAVSIAPGDSGFVSFKLLLTRDMTAGDKYIRYDLINEANEKVATSKTSLMIEPRERLNLLADSEPILITKPDDSVRVRMKVNNDGNIPEQLILVFNVPNLQSMSPFTEVTVTLDPGEQKELIHSFIASSNLLASEQFQVRVTLMKGREKKIIDTKTITIRSVSTRRSYHAFQHYPENSYGDGPSYNAIQLSYRTFNNTSSTVQLQGGGYVDLPAGYLYVKGNIYKYNAQSQPYVTNTSLTYRLYGNEFSIGNVSEQAELSLYGRGIKILFSDSIRSKRLTLGAIDQNYNLFSTDDWFDKYYSFFVKGDLGADSESSTVTAAYIFQKNPYELAQFHMASIAWRARIKKQWELEIKSHGSMAQYQNIVKGKFTGAAELRYNGLIFSDLLLNGSLYYSDPYFSGNRKGSLSFSQSASKRFTDDINLSGSFSYNKSEPKSYTYNYNYLSYNNFGNLSVSLPELYGFTSSLIYYYQRESSSSYSRYIGQGSIDQNLTMASHRLGWQWRWQHPTAGHSFFGNLEGGYYRNPVNESLEKQGKMALSYSYRGFTTGVIWQQGAYYLYEQAMSLQHKKEFTRFSAAASVNHRFSKNFHLTSGFNFTRDIYQGNIPSFTMNMQYFTLHNLSLSFSGYWYKYPSIQNGDIFNLEAGIRYQFKRGQPFSGKKSRLIAKVYYDYNGNNRYDKSDAPAKNYLIDIDQKVFVTSKKGEVGYTFLPYGKYTIRPMNDGPWLFDNQEIAVSRHKTEVNVALRQSGTLRGSISYLTVENSIQIVPRNEGFRFTISDVNGKIRQTVVTDADGYFVTFLPVGEYTVSLDKRTLVEHTECSEPVRNIIMEAGKINELEPFVMEVKTRKVNVKKFFAQEAQ